MADMKQIFIISLIVLACGVGIFSFSTPLLSSYGVTMSDNFSRTQTKMENAFNNVTSFSSQMQESLNSDDGFSVLDGVQIVKGVAISALKLPFKIIGVVTSLISDVSTNIPGFPVWVFSLIIALITAVIAIAVFSAIWRHNI